MWKYKVFLLLSIFSIHCLNFRLGSGVLPCTTWDLLVNVTWFCDVVKYEKIIVQIPKGSSPITGSNDTYAKVIEKDKPRRVTIYDVRIIPSDIYGMYMVLNLKEQY